tara:strand:+ start:170 stop:1369 length:1200 start_codon:yes stop_codon:yes gene_type:complete
MTKVKLSEPIFDNKEINSAIKTIKSLNISQGKKVLEFEKSFSSYIGTKYGIATNSGSSANLITLSALKEYYKLKNGDEVIVPAATFATVAMPIIQIGLKPVYTDIDIKTFNIDPNKISKAITKKTKIIMIVHTLGNPVDMAKVSKIAKKHKLIIFEDCCEAHGASINNKKVGSMSTISAFSFFVAHNITTGEGGMILTNNKKLEKICRSLREFGRIDQKDSLSLKKRFKNYGNLKKFDSRYLFERLGYNMRMTDILAAFGVEQVKKLNKLNKKRSENANKFDNFFKNETSKYFSLTTKIKGAFHSYYTYPILINSNAPFKRIDLVIHLENKGIETRPLFCGCLPDQPAFKNNIGRNADKLTNARYARDNLLFFGIHPSISKREIDYVKKVFIDFLKQYE